MAEKISVRLPDDLLLKVDAAGARTEVVTTAVRLYFEPKPAIAATAVDAGDLAAARVEIDLLQGDVAQLKRELAASRRSAPVAVPAGKSAPIDRKTHHPAGPVRASAVPSNVPGQAIGFNLKGYKA